MKHICCPACQAADTRPGRRYTADLVAEHFVPKQRDPERHAGLRQHVASLWGQDHADVWMCASCGFGFSVPWVGGDAAFYAFAYNADPHYPTDRWEFGETLAALGELDSPLRIAEIGAGHGAFLDQLRTLRHPSEIVAADLDEGAVAVLRAKGYTTLHGSLDDLVETHERFDVVCMFQTLEHIADLEAVFQNLRTVLSPGGSVFISVPNGEATALQEDVTGFWDIPPNHVGRWNPTSIQRAGERHGFGVEVSTEPVRVWRTTWQLAIYTVNARSYTPGTLDGWINSVDYRPARGMLKRARAIRWVPALLGRRSQFKPLSCWARLRLLSS